MKRLTQDEIEGGELPGVIHDIAEYRVEPEAGIDSDPVPLQSKERKCFITGSKYYLYVGTAYRTHLFKFSRKSLVPPRKRRRKAQFITPL